MADAQMLTLDIVTPRGHQLQQEVDEFTAPSVDGEFGVLPGHRPLLAALRTGIVSYRCGAEETRVAVGAGFVEVSQDKATLITDRYARKADIDAVRVRLDLKEADAALENFDGEPGSSEHLELVARELWAAAQLELYGDPPPPTVLTFNVYTGGGDLDESGVAEAEAETH